MKICRCGHYIKDHDEDSGYCHHPGCECDEPTESPYTPPISPLYPPPPTEDDYSGNFDPY